MDSRRSLGVQRTRHVVTVVALTGAVLLAGVAGTHLAKAAGGTEGPTSGTTAPADADATATRLLEQAASATAASADGVTKEETVHVACDAQGAVRSVTSVNVLKNKAALGVIADASTLTALTCPDDVICAQDGTTLAWDAQGDDVTYTGTSAEEPPVGVDISYQLDGRDVSASELEGASGAVSVTYTFANASETPLLAAAVLELDDACLADASIDNGTILEGTDSSTAVGLALPGLQEQLDLDGDAGIELPTSFTLTAQATGFHLDAATILVSAAPFQIGRAHV